MCVPIVFLLYEDIMLTDWYTDSLATPHGFTAFRRVNPAFFIYPLVGFVIELGYYYIQIWTNVNLFLILYDKRRFRCIFAQIWK